jgi:hypothetical protein
MRCLGRHLIHGLGGYGIPRRSPILVLTTMDVA